MFHEVNAISNQKFGQLIKENMRNNFLEKSYTRYGRETISIPFPRTFLDQYLLTYWSFPLRFPLTVGWRINQIIVVWRINQ